MTERPMIINIGEFIAATSHMSGEQTGAFGLLLMSRWKHGSLPPDEEALIRIAKVTPAAWRDLQSRGAWWPYSDARATIAAAIETCVVTRRETISDSLRAAVFERDGEKCAYCGNTNGPFHLDHVHPFIRGGQSTEENLVVACASCNCAKGSRTVEEWRQ